MAATDTDAALLPVDPPQDLIADLAALFDDFSEARTDYGPAPTRPDIATPEAAAIRAFEMVINRLGLRPTSTTSGFAPLV